MKNVYKSLFETIPIVLGFLLLAGLLGYDPFNPILDGILFFSIWGKSYQYWTEREKETSHQIIIFDNDGIKNN